jgi:hypothetical protein
LSLARRLLWVPSMLAALETTFAFALIGWTLLRMLESPER